MDLVTGRQQYIQYLNDFKSILGELYVFTNEEVLNNYAHDETENLHFLPDIVIKPSTARYSNKAIYSRGVECGNENLQPT